MQVQKITVNNFKRVEKVDVELSPITALVGGNTSGKSSIIQAVQLCVSLLQSGVYYTGKKTKKIKFYSTVSADDVAYKPTNNLLELRYGGEATQNDGYSIGLECGYETDDGDVVESVNLNVLRGKNANLSLTFSGELELAGKIADAANTFSILSPGLSGIARNEEWKTSGAIKAAVMHGDANLYLRTVIDHLLNKSLDTRELKQSWDNEGDIAALPQGEWRTFSELLDRCYCGARVFVAHDPSVDQYIDVSVTYQDDWFTLDIASTGMLQVIQILAYACLYKPALLLLDEPDAHLHADSQGRLYEALRGLVQSTGTRILLASHSPQLIQRLEADPNASVVWLNHGEVVDVDSREKSAVPLLMELGALGVGVEIFEPSKSILFLSEDKDLLPVMALCRAVGGGDNIAFMSYNGCGNLNGARQLARLMRDIRPEIDVVIHRDRDFRTDEEVTFEKINFESWCQSEGVERVFEVYTNRNDVESSFMEPSHINECFEESISISEAEKLVADAISDGRDDFTGRLREARSVIDSTIYSSDRLRKKESWREAGLPDNVIKHKKFLPKSGNDPLQLDQAHGKALAAKVRHKIHGLIGGDSSKVFDRIFKPSEYLVFDDFEVVLSRIQNS